MMGRHQCKQALLAILLLPHRADAQEQASEGQLCPCLKQHRAVLFITAKAPRNCCAAPKADPARGLEPLVTTAPKADPDLESTPAVTNPSMIIKTIAVAFHPWKTRCFFWLESSTAPPAPHSTA
jgi:hypothetical protein